MLFTAAIYSFLTPCIGELGSALFLWPETAFTDATGVTDSENEPKSFEVIGFCSILLLQRQPLATTSWKFWFSVQSMLLVIAFARYEYS
ncbi:hypothetical protein NL676_034329 [Syzygium grande]|nr:hypothetical protein NL676_034329 [Syzygium grande]